MLPGVIMLSSNHVNMVQSMRGYDMNVRQCPACKKYDVVLIEYKSEIGGNFTELHLPAYCPDCGYSWYIIYTPDRTEDRQ